MTVKYDVFRTGNKYLIRWRFFIGRKHLRTLVMFILLALCILTIAHRGYNDTWSTIMVIQSPTYQFMNHFFKDKWSEITVIQLPTYQLVNHFSKDTWSEITVIQSPTYQLVNHFSKDTWSEITVIQSGTFYTYWNSIRYPAMQKTTFPYAFIKHAPRCVWFLAYKINN